MSKSGQNTRLCILIILRIGEGAGLCILILFICPFLILIYAKTLKETNHFRVKNS